MTIKRTHPVDRLEAIAAYTDFLRAIGYEPEQIEGMCSGPSGRNTAVRAVDALLEFFEKEQEFFSFTTFPAEGARGMVAVTHIRFVSMCAHHILPFVGEAHVGYIPDKLVCGLSKIVRVVDHYAHRPSIQEILTDKIATFLWEQLQPKGVGVVVEAEHMCMAIRGVERPGHLTVTSDVRGDFEEVAVRNEFLSLVHQSSLRR
uniref:GTP cyclohydrolase I n=1 Tax=viral metagenome TaxID=1070528 RepID=A0A6M3J1L3_9ZZZZ